MQIKDVVDKLENMLENVSKDPNLAKSINFRMRYLTTAAELMDLKKPVIYFDFIERLYTKYRTHNNNDGLSCSDYW